MSAPIARSRGCRRRGRRRHRRYRGARARSSDTTLSLVAYSIPTPVFPKLIAAFQATPAGSGVKFTTSFGGSRCRARPSSPGCPPTSSTSRTRPTWTGSSHAGLVDQTWDSNQVQRHRLELGHRLRRSQRQSEAHQDVGRPREAGRRRRLPEPVQLGRRTLGRHGAPTGRSCAAKQDAKQAQAYLKTLFQHNVVAGHERARNAIEHVPLRQGRCPASTTRAKRSSRSAGQADLRTSSRR